MYPELAAAIETLAIPPNREGIAEAVSLRDQLDARISAAVSTFEGEGRHQLDGSVAMSAWLRKHAGMDPRSAGRCVHRAKRLRSLPELRAAFESGRFSLGRVEIILRNVGRHVDRFAQHEGELLDLLEPLSIDDLTKAMIEWRAMADALDEEALPPEHDNEVHLSQTIDGRGEVHGSLDGDLFSLATKAFDLADPNDFALSPAQRRAVALGQILQHFLDNQHVHRSRRHRPHVTVSLSYREWADREFAGPGTATYTDTGLPVGPITLAAMRCDANWHELTFTGRAAILNYGRATRSWPQDLFNVIAVRDAGCRWPGCSAPPSWCDVHHVDWWEHGGATSVDNGVMLCRRHHHKLHSKQGWRLKLLPDGTVDLTHPDGAVEISDPRGPVAEQFWRQRRDGG